MWGNTGCGTYERRINDLKMCGYFLAGAFLGGWLVVIFS